MPETSPQPAAGSASARELSGHRERIVRVLLTGLAWLGIVAYVPSLWLSIAVGAWTVAVADTLMYGAVLGALLTPGLPYRTRAGVLIGSAYLLGAVLLLLLGPVGAGPLWLCAVPVLAAILFERRETLWSLLLTALLLAGAGVLLATGSAPWGPAPADNLGLFAVIAANLLFLSAGLALAVNALIDGLRRGAERSERLAAQLAAEQTRLREAETLTALGTLAGGIAHNLNNLLTPLLMGIDMLREEEDPEARADVLDRMSGAAATARQLVRQVLTFGRPTSGTGGPVDAAGVFGEELRRLRSDLPPNVDLRVQLDPRTGAIPLSPADAHQLLLSLAANAVEAMPDGGTLAVELGVERGGAPWLDETAEYARLLVRDTGVGMDEDTRRRAVEPFFTTRSIASATGLGLAMVHGIVKAAGGALVLESAPGAGTTVRVFLPRAG